MKFNKLYIIFLFLFVLSFYNLKVFSQENIGNNKTSSSIHSQNNGSTALKREFSQANKIFDTVKDGVVTIVSSVGHGSGFLVDEKGLILTNSHVVKCMKDFITVRFKANQMVKGIVVEDDTENDIAVIWVNLKNIKKYSVLKMFVPPSNEPLVVPGEKILAIGSPVKWEAYEKTLTQGIISKYSDLAIMHDANIDGGNSGGPLLNFAGQAIGLNTFGPTSDNSSMTGSVSILKAVPLVKSAIYKIKNLTPPSEELIPDVSSESYHSRIMAMAYQSAGTRERNRYKPYKLKSRNYHVFIATPPQTYRENMKSHNRLSKRLPDSNNDNNGIIIDRRSYTYIKPVVTLEISPRLRQTKKSIVGNIIKNFSNAYLDQTDNYYGRRRYYRDYRDYEKYVYKKDFRSLSLINKNTGKVYQPFTSGRAKTHTDIRKAGYYTVVIAEDSTYRGRYEFDPKYFDTKDELVLEVYSMDGKKPDKIKINPKIKKYIVDDFRPYWDYLSEKKKL